MRKLTIVAALLFAMTIPTLTSYAGVFDSMVDQGNSKQQSTIPYVNPASLPGGKDNPWSVTNVAGDVNYYPGRIIGTWQKRGEDYYYVLPDGSDLTNNYVDNLYLSWTGKMIPENSPGYNRFIYNSLYGGQAPVIAFMDSFPRSRYVNFLGSKDNWDVAKSEYISGAWKTPDYAKEAFDWMDAQMPGILALPECERAVAIARIVATNLTYINTSIVPADGFHTRSGNYLTFASVYEVFARRAGLTVCTDEYGKAPNNEVAYWNCINLNGTIYYVDTAAFNITKQDVYLLSPTLWSGYISHESMDEAERKRLDNIVVPTDKGLYNNPTSGLTEGAF